MDSKIHMSGPVTVTSPLNRTQKNPTGTLVTGSAHYNNVVPGSLIGATKYISESMNQEQHYYNAQNLLLKYLLDFFGFDSAEKSL